MSAGKIYQIFFTLANLDDAPECLGRHEDYLCSNLIHIRNSSCSCNRPIYNLYRLAWLQAFCVEYIGLSWNKILFLVLQPVGQSEEYWVTYFICEPVFNTGFISLSLYLPLHFLSLWWWQWHSIWGSAKGNVRCYGTAEIEGSLAAAGEWILDIEIDAFTEISVTVSAVFYFSFPFASHVQCWCALMVEPCRQQEGVAYLVLE